MKLFVDSVRDAPNDEWVVARSSVHAIRLIRMFGLPDVINFEYILGDGDTSMPIVDWLIGQILQGEIRVPPTFVFYVNTDVDGAETLEKKFGNFLNFWFDNNLDAS